VNSGHPSAAAAHGRKTLVPGFMAGIEALHKRFRRLAFSDLFLPAIWYAENGTSCWQSIVTAAAFAVSIRMRMRTNSSNK